ncbi:PAB-dependent poly(A)-specific ribonuclease subunit PAN2 [Hypsizygus marmoreus]|uniref:PAN2-PAN3 deadenylation complex catalytic subunit PAN2 n=1 Tax=Hypsizygus marmoreus TaxID=39966 RepID=A0A369JMS7_HYPMA|nr:PAB-dependent poly(A)-specific ribonuclease subunit PAN2 [Hypsizygus marmoreus]
MSTSYRPITSITAQGFPQPVTALSFDPVSDVLWAGSNTGGITAYYGPRGVRGVSFRVGGSLAVKKIVAGENHVKALGVSGEGIGSWAKGGMNKWYFRHPSNLTTFSNTPNSNLRAASTADLELLYINSMTGIAVRQITTPSMITHLQPSHSMLLSGSTDGYLRTHDIRTGRSGGMESLVKAHSSGIQGLQTAGNFAFTIGLGERQSRPFPDPLVKVYDIRTMRSLPPIAFSSGPAFIHVLPKRSSTIAIVSNEGLINIVDILNPAAASEFYQLDLTSYITSCSVSPTSAYMAFGDAEGSIHLLSQAEDVTGVPFNGFEGHSVEWADTPAPLPDVEWTNKTPLNVVGLPYYDSHLMSAWSHQLTPPLVSYPPPQRLPPQILNTMRMKDNVAYAALPKDFKGHRNMTVVETQKHNGRFRSGKPRQSNHIEPVTPTFDSDVPRMYRHVEIEYSKFGVEDFDFGFYNKTEYSGLETHILNSYTNPVLQVMHHTLPIRILAKSHISTNCLREHCLLCEIGFVARMLEDAKGINCQSSNFCKTVGVLAQASNAIELLDYGRDTAEVDYGHKIQIFHRFLIDHLSSEGNTFPHNPLLLKLSHEQSFAPAPVTQLLGIDGKNLITCSNCKAVREKENMTHVVDLTYPRKPVPSEPPQFIDFAGVLRLSLLRQMTHKATCQSCKSFASFTSQRSIPSRELPPILAINACVYNDENMSLWLDARGQTFLKPQIQLNGQIDGEDDPMTVEYALRAVVVQIKTKEKPSHLVAIVKVPEAEGHPASPWFLFNDFVVRNISEDEALSFPDKWKVPAIVYYERLHLQEALDYSALPEKIDDAILSHDTSISLNRDVRLIQHECLRPEELPRPGTLVAIDAEFVSMQQEETEFRSDGTNRVLRPARLSLARVSVLRGDGLKEGVPFIDDHIHTSEVIVDYLTEFSGIKFGDLDPHLSRYTLTPLKLVYKKLRLLVDRGCIFIGHGLSKDFRIINIFVPPEQVIDTVDLYFLKARQRRLSLRFLSWFVLHEQIQTDMHDSIEDARSALNLYKAYHDMEEKGLFDQKLEDLYKEGRLHNFKPPPFLGSPGTTQVMAMTPDRAASPAYSTRPQKATVGR